MCGTQFIIKFVSTFKCINCMFLYFFFVFNPDLYIIVLAKSFDLYGLQSTFKFYTLSDVQLELSASFKLFHLLYIHIVYIHIYIQYIYIYFCVCMYVIWFFGWCWSRSCCNNSISVYMYLYHFPILISISILLLIHI